MKTAKEFVETILKCTCTIKLRYYPHDFDGGKKAFFIRFILIDKTVFEQMYR